MNNVDWNTQEQDNFWELLDRCSNHDILIETNVTFRLSNTKYFDSFTGKMTDCDEKLIRFAFYE